MTVWEAAPAPVGLAAPTRVRGETMLRSGEPVAPELRAFLARKRSATSVGAPSTAPVPLGVLLADGDPWPADHALALLRDVAALVDFAAAGGTILGTFTPWCVAVYGPYLLVTRHDARAGLDPAAVAPEQMRPDVVVDARGTQYGLALVAAALLAGTRPAAAPRRAFWRRREADDGVPATLAAPVRRVLHGARHPDPDQRFVSTTAFVTALAAACDECRHAGTAVLAPVAAAPRARFGVVEVAGVALAAGAGGWYAAQRPTFVPPELRNDSVHGLLVADSVRRAAADSALLAASLVDTAEATVGAVPARGGAFATSRLFGTPPAAPATTTRESLPPVSFPTVAIPVVPAPRPDSARVARRLASTPADFATGSELRAGVRALDNSGGTAGAIRIAGAEEPRYPDALLAARIPGAVVARFLVDSAGHVDPASVTVLRSSRAEFTTAVLNAIPNLRFVPAESRGRRVGQMVEQTFQFTPPR